MAIRIINNITTIDIYFDDNGDKYSIHKANITLEKSYDTVVIVDSGRVPAKEYQLFCADIVVPLCTSSDSLFAELLAYVNVEQAETEEVIESDADYIKTNGLYLKAIYEQQILTNNLLKLILS